MKIWIWGTGWAAKNVLENGVEEGIVFQGFIETKKTKEVFLDYPVLNASDIPLDFDYIIVANRFSDQIYDWCAAKRFDMHKIIFMIRGRKTEVMQDLSVLSDVLGERNLTRYKAQYGIYTETFIDEDKALYQKLNHRKNFEIKESDMWPILEDKFAENGVMGNYFWQDLWAAKYIIQSHVKEHYDIGSRIDGFIAHLLAADIRVNVIDIRKFPSEVENLYTIVDDATLLSQFEPDSIDSMSALCSLEHFGLGRYGDPIDPEACFKCFDSIQEKLRTGGMLYLSVPVGKERVEFNAHRIFYAGTIVKCFRKMELLEFSCAAEGKIEYDVDINKYDADCHNGEHRYGLFRFRKK